MAIPLFLILRSILRKSRRDSDSSYPPMASFSSSSSSSSSLSTPQYRYDVFPSFSGKDVRRNFLSHFLEGLKSKGIKTFVDDDGIKRSESINSELVRAIMESRIAVVILSKNYASSSWCLNELQLIMECRVSLEQTVMTIFYDVEPSDVRKQTGEFGKAFQETCHGKTEEEQQRWTKALTQVAVIAGLSCTRDSEAEIISKIIMDVSKELPSTDYDQLVGIEAHVEKIKSMICLESDEVKFVGIWGPAGIGKTTIAKALYNQISSNFQLKYYKNNVAGKSTVIRSQDHIQNELFSGVLDHRDMKIPNTSDVTSRLLHQRVLLILDDFTPEQLQALQVTINQLSFGSKVIVTSEDLSTLEDCRIEKNHTYIVAYPSRQEAMQIFSYSAFGQSSPPRGFSEHATQVHTLVDPVPLGLKLLGSSLRGKSKDEWTKRLPKLRNSLQGKDIKKVIKVFYHGLSDKHKAILRRLAISANLGENVNNAIFSLAKTDWDVEKGIQTLADLAPISISRDGGIVLHHLIQSSISKENDVGN